MDMDLVDAKKYDLAISFAGEERNIAEGIAEQLNKKGFNIFYDNFYEADLWGKDLAKYLGSIYSSQAKFCLVIASKNYVAKAWTIHELQHALSTQLVNKNYILLLRMDDTPIPGYADIYSYVKFESIDKTIILLEKKLVSDVVIKEKSAMKRKLNKFVEDILRYEGMIDYVGDYSPDDDDDYDERDLLAEAEGKYHFLMREYQRRFKEYYDPYGIITSG